MTTPELTHLRAFVMVAELRNYRRAATHLNLSPSAVSQAVRALEEALGVTLLNRTTRSVSMTESGAALDAQLRGHLDGLDAALEQAANSRNQASGKLKLNVPRSAAAVLLEPIIVAFLEAHPLVRLEVVTNNGFVDIVESGCDAGIRYAESVPLDMVALPMGPAQHWVVVANPSFIERNGTPTDPWALAKQPCVRLRFPSGAIYRWEFERDNQRIALEVDGPLIVDDSRMTIRAALDGVGWAYLHEAMVRTHIESGRLISVLVDWAVPPRAFPALLPRSTTSQPGAAGVHWLDSADGCSGRATDDLTSQRSGWEKRLPSSRDDLVADLPTKSAA